MGGDFRRWWRFGQVEGEKRTSCPKSTKVRTGRVWKPEKLSEVEQGSDRKRVKLQKAVRSRSNRIGMSSYECSQGELGREKHMSRKNQIGTCELCSREEVEVTVHHLTPKEMGGTFLPTASLCIPCHKQIHALFTNEELAASLNSIDLLRMNPQIHKFLRWIKRQPPKRLPRISKSNERKRKKR